MVILTNEQLTIVATDLDGNSIVQTLQRTAESWIQDTYFKVHHSNAVDSSTMSSNNNTKAWNDTTTIIGLYDFITEVSKLVWLL